MEVAETFGIGAIDSWRRSGVLCDVEVVVEGGRFACHRLTLASQSLFFRARFLRPMREMSGWEVVPIGAEQVSEDAFEQVLRYIYQSADFQLTSGNVANLMLAADYLQVPYRFLLCSLSSQAFGSVREICFCAAVAEEQVCIHP